MSYVSRKETRIAVVATSVLVLLLAQGCRHTPTHDDLVYAQIRYDLALNEAEQGNLQVAFRELQAALDRHPDFAEAHNATGLLLHVSFGRHSQAEEAYLAALRAKPGFSDAHNNLGALYIDMGRYQDAEKHLRKALDDVLYATPHIAQGNLGWTLFLQGRHEEALTQLRSAVLVQPRFCLGHRNIGRIYRDRGRMVEARASFEQFAKHCPEVPEAQYELGRVAYEAGDVEGARAAFEACRDIASDGGFGELCEAHLDGLSSGGAGSRGGQG